MPINCPRDFLEQDACLDCYYKQGNECWGIVNTPRRLSTILTLEERIVMLEESREPQTVDLIHRTSDMSKKEFDHLEQTYRLAKYLEHIEKSKPKRKYKEYKV